MNRMSSKLGLKLSWSAALQKIHFIADISSGSSSKIFKNFFCKKPVEELLNSPRHWLTLIFLP